jgi:hypothetical protein
MLRIAVAGGACVCLLLPPVPLAPTTWFSSSHISNRAARGGPDPAVLARPQAHVADGAPREW